MEKFRNMNKVEDEIFFSVDGEFDGPYPPDHSMLSVGAVAFTLADGILDEFSVNIKPLPGATMEKRVKTEFWDRNPEAYAATLIIQQEPKDAMQAFSDFYYSLAKSREGVFLEYPGAIDYFWCHWYFMKFLGDDPFGHSGQFGVKTYASAFLKRPLRHSTKRNMPKAWFSSKLPHTHIAVDDARQQAHIAIRMMCANLDITLPNL